MIEAKSHPLLEAVNAVLGFPTTEDLLNEGQTVSLADLTRAIGDRLVLPQGKICKSYVRSLAASIIKHGMVVVPILVAKDGDNYVVVDGLHRLAALEMVKGMEPELIPSARVKMIKNHIINN